MQVAVYYEVPNADCDNSDGVCKSGLDLIEIVSINYLRKYPYVEVEDELSGRAGKVGDI